MKLRLKRSEGSKGVLSKSLVFCLDARLELTPAEAEAVRKYKLGEQCIYNSEQSKKHLMAGATSLMTGGVMGVAKAGFKLAMSQLQLNITLDTLTRGQHIQCKDLDEVLDAEQSLMKACENAAAYLATAATFNSGSDEVFEITPPEPKKLVLLGSAEAA